MIDPLAMCAGFIAYNLVRIAVSLPKRREVRRRLGAVSAIARDCDLQPADAPFLPHRFGSKSSRLRSHRAA